LYVCRRENTTRAYHGALKSSNIRSLESLMQSQRRRNCQTLREVA
jgi:hypothetical protein